MKTLKSSFSISKIDDINLNKYNLSLKKLKSEIKNIIDILFDIKELKKSKIFNKEINKVRFDISFCSDKTIHQINKEYRQKDCSTDVITFSLFYDDSNSIIYRRCADLGQIIVCVETADRQKVQNNNSLNKEIMTLVCHGVLHLLGFDHLTKKDYDFVVGIQNKVLLNYE